MKQVLKIMGINSFMAVKKWYNLSIDKNDFYSMLKRRLKTSNPKDLSSFLVSELQYHFKEVAQYQ